MKVKKLNRFVSLVFIVNMLITMPFAASATPPQSTKKHYRSYSESYIGQIGLEEITDTKRMEEYKKKGYEDGLNNVLVKPFVPRRYRTAYEDEYKRGQEEYRKKIINEKVTENKVNHETNDNGQETDDERFEKYKKRGYEDGLNNVLVKPFVPRRYRTAYEDEYKRGQEEYKKKINNSQLIIDEVDSKGKVINEKENTAENKVHNDINSKEQEIYNKRMEEYKKKGYEDGYNNVAAKIYIPQNYKKAYEDEYKRGQEEYRNNAIRKFGYEDGIKNCKFMESLTKFPESYQSIYEREYRKGLVIYFKDHLSSLIMYFGKELPKTVKKDKKLGIIHGLNNAQYRIGAPDYIQNEYSQAYFFAQKVRLNDQGYNDAIKNINKKTLKKTFIIKLYGQWYNEGLKRGKEEYIKKLEELKKQGYKDGLKKNKMAKNISAEFESTYKSEYERGRENYIKKVMERFKKHLLKIKEKYAKTI